MSDRPPRFITPQGFARIRAEYELLFGTERPKVVEVVSWAASLGDRSENADYHYGKKRLREIDRRLSYLSKVMKSAKVVDPARQQQRDHGTMIAKLFFHVTAERQAATLRAWQEDPWLRHLKEHQPVINVGQREQAMDVLHDFFAQTNTRWAPWQIIDDNDPVAGSIAALTAIADMMEKVMPAEPPEMGETVVQFRSPKTTETNHA